MTRYRKLLEMHDLHHGYFGKMASMDISDCLDSGVWTALINIYNRSGREFTRALRAIEMDVVSDQTRAHLIRHHFNRAAECFEETMRILAGPFAKNGEYEFYPARQRCKITRETYEFLLDRLEPVFPFFHLFDPKGIYKTEFYSLQRRCIALLDEADLAAGKGTGMQKRRYENYRLVTQSEFPALIRWFGDLRALLNDKGQ